MIKELILTLRLCTILLIIATSVAFRYALVVIIYPIVDKDP